MESVFTVEDEHNIFTVEFVTSRPLRMYHPGKAWPITTQCVLKKGNLIIGVGQAVKHEKDNDNPVHGRKVAAQKAFLAAEHKIWKEIRIEFWEQILADMKQNEIKSV